jgi:hypothetical protein
MKKIIPSISLILASITIGKAQMVTALATGPTSVCTNITSCFTNGSSGGTTAFWTAGSTNIGTAPTFSNTTLSYQPAYNEAAFDGTNYYLFVTEYSSGTVYRHNFGSSPLNTPTVTSLGSFSVTNVEGIEIQKDGSNWYGFIVGNVPTGTIMRLDFGTTLTNTPTATNLGPMSLSWPHDIKLYKASNNYYAFVVNRASSSVTRLDFGTTLTNIPTATNFTATAGTYSVPSNIFISNDGTNFYGFVTNVLANNITRLNFGTSLTNTPTYTQLAVSASLGTHMRGITILKDCSINPVGYVLTEYSNQFIKLDFTTGLSGTPVMTSLSGSLAANTTMYGLDISNTIRYNDMLYAFVSNNGLSNISRLNFASTASNPGSSTSTNLFCPMFTVNGTYTLSLVIDEGEATQSNYCKTITSGACTGIKEYGTDHLSSVYPNPVQHSFKVVSTDVIPQMISVVNVLGREILKVKPMDNSTSIDINNESDGLYFVKVRFEHSEEIIKLIKQ